MSIVPGEPNKLISADMLFQEFERRGYTYSTQRLNGRLFARIEGPDGFMWLTSYGYVSYPMNSFAAIKICASKEVAYEYAESQGVATPRTLRLSQTTPDEMQAFLAQYGRLVVKPAHSHGSKGVTLDITSPEQLSAAIVAAQLPRGRDVLLQRQFIGQEVRITVLNGKVISAILRQTPQVRGDGQATIAELIARDNEARSALSFDCIVYPPLDESLVGSIVHDQRVPAEGEVVELSKNTMVRGGASFHNVTDDVHDSYKATALRLTSKLSPGFMVIDMMIADYTQPSTDDNYIFLEFNTSPSLKLYYGVRSGEPLDIVPLLADAVIARLRFPQE